MLMLFTVFQKSISILYVHGHTDCVDVKDNA